MQQRFHLHSQPTAVADRVLVKQTLAGDEDAFETLVRRYQHEVQRILREAIEGLPPRLRSVVLLRYTDQLSFSEIGQRLKMPTGTAKAYFYRARPLLRAALMRKD